MSTISSSSPSTTPATTPSAAATMSTASASIPIHHAITIKLTKKNYLLWRAQLLPYLRSTNLIGYMDGSIPALAKQVASSTTAGADLVSNPVYTVWYNQDQQLLSSMAEDVLHDVTDDTSLKEAWVTLKWMFSSSTQARTVQIHEKLATIKKLDLSPVDYFAKVKHLVADAALTDDEVIVYLLAGLPSNYDSFVTSMTTKSEPLTLDDVYMHT
jgi:hypothetical protein